MWGDTPYLSVFSPNAGKYGPEKTPYLDIFLAVPSDFYGIIEVINRGNFQIGNKETSVWNLGIVESTLNFECLFMTETFLTHIYRGNLYWKTSFFVQCWLSNLK